MKSLSKGKFAAIVTVVAALLAGPALWLGSMTMPVWMGGRAYGAEKYSNAANNYKAAADLTPEIDGLEPWKNHYNLGTSYVRTGSLESAVVSLTKALDGVPKDPEPDPNAAPSTPAPDAELTPECRVRMNLSVAYELQGDALGDTGHHAESAAKHTTAAETIAQCSPASQQSEQQEKDNKEKAAEQKREEEMDKMKQSQEPGDEETTPGDGPTTPGEDQTTPGDEPSNDGGEGGLSDKEKELQDRNSRGEEEYRNGRGQGGDYGNWDGDNW